MPNKPIKQGYQIYGIADHGYIYNWTWSSREKGLQDMLHHPSLTNAGCLLRNLTHTLPRRQITVYLDNYFASIPLFSELRACNFGAVGTTRPHEEFPDELSELKARFATKLEWNTLLAAVVRDVLCLAWQDNNIVLALSNIHTVDETDDFREKVRKRPAKTSTNGRIVRRVFGDEHTKQLPIPRFIDDYNQYMGGIDLANQYREAYETHRPTCRTWWPLFCWLIDVACINAYKLHQLHAVSMSTRPLTHLQFRIELYCKLLGYSQRAKLQSLRVELGGKRVFNPDFQHLHYWEKRRKGTCAWCSYQSRCQKVLGKAVKGTVKRSTWGCSFCNVSLCQEGRCWARYHSNDVLY
jgi:Transposase IS4